MSKTIQDLLSEVNAELKAARIGVVVRVRGDRLSLRGTFPPKPGSQKTDPHQQDIALSIYANPAGFRRAKAEAIRIGGLLACKEFKWEDLGFGFKPTDSISDWLEKFERDYFNRRARTPKTETSFEDYLDTWKLFKDKAAPLTAETILVAALKSPPDSRQRNRACIALGALAKFAGIEIDLKPYRGRYSPYAAIQERDLPSDERIEEWYKRIPNPAWQWAYGIMATYGIRNHELFYLDLREFHQSPGILIIQEGGKTGQRKVWPCRHWWEKWNLGNIKLPQCTGKVISAQAYTHFCLAFQPSNRVFSHALVVLTVQSYSGFCMLQSRIHEIWARFFSATAMDLSRYNPSDCFQTFPFPKNWETNPTLEAIGKTYYEYRADLMVRNNQGLTDTYNRFHNPEERHPDILKLRELHAEMDRAVLDVYGWTDIPTGCEFLLDYEEEEEEEDSSKRQKKKPWRYRWPEEVHDEVLARLLDLNQKRHEEEILGGKHAETKSKAKKNKAKSKKSSPSSTPTIPGLEL